MIRIRPETSVAAAERLARRLGCIIVVHAGEAYLKRERNCSHCSDEKEATE